MDVNFYAGWIVTIAVPSHEVITPITGCLNDATHSVRRNDKFCSECGSQIGATHIKETVPMMDFDDEMRVMANNDFVLISTDDEGTTYLCENDEVVCLAANDEDGLIAFDVNDLPTADWNKQREIVLSLLSKVNTIEVKSVTFGIRVTIS